MVLDNIERFGVVRNKNGLAVNSFEFVVDKDLTKKKEVPICEECGLPCEGIDGQYWYKTYDKHMNKIQHVICKACFKKEQDEFEKEVEEMKRKGEW